MIENLNVEEEEKISYEERIKNIAKRKNFDIASVKKILDLRNQIFSKLRNLDYSFTDSYFESLSEFTQRKGRAECQKYLAWHIAVGSTPDENLIQFLDFEGEDNIQNLLENFLSRLPK